MTLEKEMKELRNIAGSDYEMIIGYLWESRPKDFPLKTEGIFANSAKGYASNSLWTDLEDQDKIRNIDLGFLLGFEAVLHRLNYLTHKIKELEEKNNKKESGIPGLGV